MGIDFYTKAELAEKLEISTKTLERMMERGELVEGTDFYRIGRLIRFFKKAMVERFHFSEE